MRILWTWQLSINFFEQCRTLRYLEFNSIKHTICVLETKLHTQLAVTDCVMLFKGLADHSCNKNTIQQSVPSQFRVPKQP